MILNTTFNFQVFVLILIISVLSVNSLSAEKYNITNFAGNSTFGFWGDNVPAQSAMFKVVKGVWASTSNQVYVSDATNFRVRLVDSSLIVTTFTGSSSTSSGDGGAASSASISTPWGLYGDSVDTLYITSFGGSKIRSVQLSTSIISSFAGSGTASSSTTASNGDSGKATVATLNGPTYITVDSIGNVYIADTDNNRVRRVDSSGIITTVAGTGTYAAGSDGLVATALSFKSITGVWVDTAGNMFIGDAGFKLRKIDATLNTGTTFAGTGTSGNSGDGGAATSALLSNPIVTWGNTNSQLFLSTGNQIRMIDLSSNIIANIAGTSTSGHTGDGGMAVDATLKSPMQLFGTRTGHYYVADSSNFVVRQLQVAPIAPTRSPTTIQPTSSLPSLTPTSAKPTVSPTTRKPSNTPTTLRPTTPTVVPTIKPTFEPTTAVPTESPTTSLPTVEPTVIPTRIPTAPTGFPALKPTPGPTYRPTFEPTPQPTQPTVVPTSSLPTTIKPSALPTTIKPTSPTVVPTTTPPSVKPSSAFPSFTPPSVKPTLHPPSVKPTHSPTSAMPSPAPSFAPTQPYRDIWFTSTVCFHRLHVSTLTSVDEKVIASSVAEVMQLNATLVFVSAQDTIGTDGAGTYQVCADVYCQARTLEHDWVIDSNTTQLYFGLQDKLNDAIADQTFQQVLNATATADGSTNLAEYSSVGAKYSSYEVIIFVPETHDDWLTPEEVGGVTVISIVGTLVALSFGLAVCSVMEEKGF